MSSKLNMLKQKFGTLRKLYLAEQKRGRALQARIDSLMLEYCPDEMTPKQIARWKKHQRPVKAASPKADGGQR